MLDVTGLDDDALQAILVGQRSHPTSTWEEQEGEAGQTTSSIWVAESDESGVVTKLCCEGDAPSENPFDDVLCQIRQFQLEAERADAEAAAKILERVQTELELGGLILVFLADGMLARSNVFFAAGHDGLHKPNTQVY